MDAALKSKPLPEDWPLRDLIWTVLRGIALLERDGVAAADALRQVDARRLFNVLAPGTDAITPDEYLVRLLREFAPSYLAHGSDLLADAIVVARDGLRELLRQPSAKENVMVLAGPSIKVNIDDEIALEGVAQ